MVLKDFPDCLRIDAGGFSSGLSENLDFCRLADDDKLCWRRRDLLTASRAEKARRTAIFKCDVC